MNSRVLKSQLARDIVRFLLEERAQPHVSADARDALGVAAECVSSALLGDDAEPAPALLPGDPSLMQLYCVGLANFDQIARAIAAQRETQSQTQTQTAPPPVVVKHVPIDAAFDDAALEARFQEYAALLAKQGYFHGVAPNSAAWVERVEKARAKFRTRFAAPSLTAAPIAAAAAAAPTATAAIPAPVVDEARAEQHKAAGNAHLQAKKYDAALAEYDAAIALNPNVAIYHANKAAALSFLNRHQEAVDAAERAIDVDPAYTKAYSRLGLALLALGRTREALAAYEQALRREPDNAQYAAAVQSTRAKLAEPAVVEPDDDDEDDDGGADGGDLAAAMRGLGGGGGGGGMPDLASMMNNPMLAGLMNNPQMRAMAQQMMSDPNAMAQMMQNPMVQNMLGGMGRGRGGGF